MSLPKKIALLWLGVLSVQAISTFYIITPISFSSLISFAIQSFITIVIFFLIFKEPTRRGKFIFINFALLFFTGLLNYVGGYFGSDEFRYHYYIYIVQGASIVLLTFAIVYLTCDTLFRNFSILGKYIIALAIVGGLFYYYYSPYFFDIKQLSKTQDYRDWGAISEVYQQIAEKTKKTPTASDVASQVTLQIWENGKAIGLLYDNEKLSRVRELLPYVETNNFMSLLFRPVYYNAIYMNVVSVLFILLFFGYQYKKDPPLGAYIEKIMLLFLILCSLEILHTWAYIYTLELGVWQEVFQMGVYVTNGILILLALFFSLRLKFIISPTGKDYEQELVRNAQRTTRWRDVFDDLLIRRYFDPKTLKGRLLALRGKDSSK